MTNTARSLRFAALVLTGLCSACAVPFYDVPLDDYGQPTVKTIIERVQCEIRDMVRNDRPADPASFNRLFLLNGDYEVLVALSLEVNDSGGLAPSISFVNPITPFATATMTLGAGGSLSMARSHTFSENVQLYTRQIFLDWKNGFNPYDCPKADTHLAGTLGIKDIVSMAASTPELAEETTGEGKAVFGGTVQFVVTKTLAATGASWQLVRFKNIAALASLSEIHTHKITLSFAPGKNKGKRMPRHLGVNAAAHQFLQQQLINAISTQLTIQNQR